MLSGSHVLLISFIFPGLVCSYYWIGSDESSELCPMKEFWTDQIVQNEQITWIVYGC